MVDIGLAAYTNRLSGRPGDTIRFHVSSLIENSNIKAKLTRCICADPNPEGPGRMEEDASEWFPPREFVGRHQQINSGSYARSQDVINVPTGIASVSVEVWMFPTQHVASHNGGDDDHSPELQCVWSWGKLGLYLKPNGCILVCNGEDTLVTSEESQLASDKWYHCKVTIDGGSSGCRCQLTIVKQDWVSKKESLIMKEQCSIETDQLLIPVGNHFELASGGTFNGKLESPQIMANDYLSSTGTKLLVGWDTSQNMSQWNIPSDVSAILIDVPLILSNQPTRAVRGHLWNGSEFHWKHQPIHYGGIHFHDDDCYDFGWDCDMEWEIPSNTPSGIYIVRLSNEQHQEEALPLFICPPLPQADEDSHAEKKKKVCVLMSTFTYGKHILTGCINIFYALL